LRESVENNGLAQEVGAKLKEVMREKNKLREIKENLSKQRGLLESDLKAIYLEANRIKVSIQNQMVYGDDM